jgi:hypothetical protein
MSISLTKRNFLIQLTILTIVVGWCGAGILHYVLPEHYFDGYPFIPVYFFLFGVFEIAMFDACRKYAPNRLLQLYMVVKTLKMLFAIFFLIAYCVIVGKDKAAFILTFVVFYIIYLIDETFFFLSYEMKKKFKKRKKENEIIA